MPPSSARRASRFSARSDATIVIVSTSAMTPRLTYVGMWYTSTMIILMPTKARMTPRPMLR